jgi:hypothetical protein
LVQWTEHQTLLQSMSDNGGPAEAQLLPLRRAG